MDTQKIISIIFIIGLCMCIALPFAAADNTNLAVCPIDFEPYTGLTVSYHSDPQIVFIDNTVLHNGHTSIRIEPHTSADVNYARELDGRWYAVSGGETVTWSYWCKMDALPSGYSVAYGGGRASLDYYDGNQLIYIRSEDMTTYLGSSLTNYVPYGNDWTYQTFTVTVPSTIIDYWGTTHTVTSLVLWLQVWDDHWGMIPDCNGWFADTNLMINPTGAPTTAPTATPNTGSTGNALITNAFRMVVPLAIVIIASYFGWKFARGWGFFAGINAGVILCYLLPSPGNGYLPLWTIPLMIIVDGALIFGKISLGDT